MSAKGADMTNEDRARDILGDYSHDDYPDAIKAITQALQEAENRGVDRMTPKIIECKKMMKRLKKNNRYKNGLLRGAEIRPSRNEMAKGWQEKQWYEVGWNNGVVAYAEAIRREAENEC